jgi:DNA-binding GntR family transcriptional regulator
MGESAAAVSQRLAALAPTRDARTAVANAADSVYLTLREAIVDGQLEPGDSLIEWHVARQFGTSRTPVREALLRLEAEGLAFRVPRRGLVVRKISEHEIFEVYAVRISLETLAAREAASEAMPSDISQLRWVNQRLAEALNTRISRACRRLPTSSTRHSRARRTIRCCCGSSCRRRTGRAA